MNNTATYVTLEDVVQYAIGRTLADEGIDRGHVISDIAISRIAHDYDLHVSDIVVQAVDVMSSGNYTWGVDIQWSVQWVECSHDAVLGETTKFTSPMCHVHLDEAYAQELADQANDDIALGL